MKAVDVGTGNLTGKVVDEDAGEGRNHEFVDLNLGIQSGVIEKDPNKCNQRGEDSNDDQHEQHPDSTHAKMREDKDENYESHTMWETELVQLLRDTANLNISGEVWEHRLRDMVTEMERFQEDQNSSFETEDTALADEGEEQNMPWWLEDDIEEDVITNTSLAIPDSRNIINAPEELLADWYQIEEDLESEGARPEGNKDDIGNNEADPSKTEALLAEWYLWEESLKAEGHLKNMELQCGTDEAKQIEIGNIIANAAVKIKNVLDTAQAEICKLLMEPDTHTTSDSAGSVNSEDVFEQDRDFLTTGDDDQGSIWTKGCDSDSHCSDDTGVDIEGIKLHLEVSCDEDQDEDNLSLYLDLSCNDNRDHELTDCWSVHSETPELSNKLKTSGRICQSITFVGAAAVDGNPSQETDSYQATLSPETMNSSGSGFLDRTDLGDRGLPPSWRWSGIQKTPIHWMPHHTSSNRGQQEDATWRRKRKGQCNSTGLILVQVKRQQHKVKCNLHYRKIMSLRMLAQHTLCALKNQMMGPAVRRQKKPLSCWRYSRTSTHGSLGQKDLRYSADNVNDLCLSNIVESDTHGSH